MTRKTKLVTGVVGVLALSGAGAALAAGGHHGGSSAARGSLVHSISLNRSAVAGQGLRGFGFGHAGGPADDIAAAADYLGTTASALVTDLQSGKTLAQVADGTSGKSSAGLIAALVAHEQTELAAAVTAGKLTQAQSDTIAANLTQRVTDLVNGTRPAGARPRRRSRPRRRPQGGGRLPRPHDRRAPDRPPVGQDAGPGRGRDERQVVGRPDRGARRRREVRARRGGHRRQAHAGAERHDRGEPDPAGHRPRERDAARRRARPVGRRPPRRPARRLRRRLRRPARRRRSDRVAPRPLTIAVRGAPTDGAAHGDPPSTESRHDVNLPRSLVAARRRGRHGPRARHGRRPRRDGAAPPARRPERHELQLGRLRRLRLGHGRDADLVHGRLRQLGAAHRDVHRRQSGLLRLLGRARRLRERLGRARADRHRGRLLGGRQPRAPPSGTSSCPRRRSTVSLTVQPGDLINASVTVSGTSVTLTIADTTSGALVHEDADRRLAGHVLGRVDRRVALLVRRLPRRLPAAPARELRHGLVHRRVDDRLRPRRHDRRPGLERDRDHPERELVEPVPAATASASPRRCSTATPGQLSSDGTSFSVTWQQVAPSVSTGSGFPGAGRGWGRRSHRWGR